MAVTEAPRWLTSDGKAFDDQGVANAHEELVDRVRADLVQHERLTSDKSVERHTRIVVDQIERMAREEVDGAFTTTQPTPED